MCMDKRNEFGEKFVYFSRMNRYQITDFRDSVALLHYIMTIVHIGYGIFQRNIESFSHTVLLSYK